MIPVLVLTHGNLATELLQAACIIDPNLTDMTSAMSLPWDVDSDEATRSLKKLLRELDRGEGTLVLTDMFGGTATNLALPFLEPDRIEVVTGVNLPMLVKLGSLKGRTPARSRRRAHRRRPEEHSGRERVPAREVVAELNPGSPLARRIQ